jgi:hypothetical protein
MPACCPLWLPLALVPSHIWLVPLLPCLPTKPPAAYLPAAALRGVIQVEVVVDTAAAAQLVRMAAPWTVTTCDWEAGGPK